jgi:hypothetical protein
MVTLRPGTYQAVITSPLTDPIVTTIHVNLFQTVDVAPQFALRNPDAIAGSVLGAVNSTIPVHVLQPKRFENGTWLVGFLVPGNPKVALHYDSVKKQWTVGYYDMEGYPQDLSQVPADVAAYIKQLGAKYHVG